MGCCSAGAAASEREDVLPRLAHAMQEAVKEYPIIWLQASTCSGCSVSVINTIHPSLKNVILEQVLPGHQLKLMYHGTVIIVDALNADAKPSSVIRLTPDEIDMEKPRSLFVHQGGLRELLHFAKQLEPLPEFVLLGVVPKSFRRLKSRLSVEVEERMASILSLVAEEAATRVALRE